MISISFAGAPADLETSSRPTAESGSIGFFLSKVYNCQAIDHGKQGHADVLATHAEAALTHAEASEKAKANPHKAEAIKHLKEAIDQGKQGNADEATTHAEIALNHLQQVN